MRNPRGVLGSPRRGSAGSLGLPREVFGNPDGSSGVSKRSQEYLGRSLGGPTVSLGGPWALRKTLKNHWFFSISSFGANLGAWGEPGGALGSPWATLRDPRGALGNPRRGSGGFLGPPWRVFGSPGGVLGGPWGVPGGPRKVPGRSLGFPGGSLGASKNIEKSLVFVVFPALERSWVIPRTP